MNAFRNIQRVRVITLLLIMGMLAGVVLPAPESRAGTDAASKGKLGSEGPGYRLKLTRSSSWDDGYVAEAVVENTGEEDIRNWSVVAVIKKGKIVNSWNAGSRVSGEDHDQVVFEPEPHNMILRPGETTSFGFQMTGGQYGDITSLELITGTSIRTGGAEVTWKETGSWEGHKIMEGMITNHSGKTLRDWSISFDMDGEITNLWNAVATDGDNGRFVVKSCSYNAVLESGQSVTFGFEVSYGTGSFGGIRNTRVYAGDSEACGETQEPQETPEKTQKPVLPTATPAVTTETPSGTKTPEPAVTPAVTGEPEKGDISGDDIEFIQVENRDWNMDMIHANDPEVREAKEVKDRKIRVTMLDSGINYSKEVDVAVRRNFVEGQDEMSCLFEDGSGHGTAVAEVLASDPEADAGEETDGVWADEEWGEYTYYGETVEEEDAGEDGETPGTEDTGIVSMADLLDSGYDWTEGVNPDIELYSGKVLDENNETTVDRVVEGIEWAIENETDILSLSLGMEKDSERLHKAIKKAAAEGMLIVAAVGDDEHVDYPAAYPEVMAVGMADSMGRTDGVHSEVAAPGDFIVSRGPFDSMQIFSGSSMAVPHVVGLASILWQKDTAKDAGFIRGLIDVSANRNGVDESCEYGLIDCRYALEAYETFEEEARENSSLLKQISRNKDSEAVKEKVFGTVENDAEVETEEEIERLHGSWDSAEHKKFVNKDHYENVWTNGGKYVKVLQSGLSFVDDKEDNPKCYGMREHPWFHGFFGGVREEKGSEKKTVTSNYMTSFRTLVELAEEMRKDGALKEISTSSGYKQVKNARNGIWQAFQDEKKVGSQTWEDIDDHCAKNGVLVPKDCRSLLIYGMALHTLGDTFSHSSYGLKTRKKTSEENPSKVKWKRYTHGDDEKWFADNITSRKLRYESAKNATKEAIRNIQVDPGKGLAGYTNIGKEIDAFYVRAQFQKLKDMHINFKNEMGEEIKAAKLEYVKEGYALKRFLKYYEQEEEANKKASGRLKKYLSYVDVDETAKTLKDCALLQVFIEEKMGAFTPFSIVRVKMDGKTILSQKPNGAKIAVLLPKDGEYTVEVSGADNTFTACTVRDGVVYDAIGRTMKRNEAEDGEEPDEEEIEVCEIADYSLSTDCLVKGKVVWFDLGKGMGSIEKMPALKGADVRFRSRKSGKIYETKTKKDGTYQIEVPAGNYDVVYEKGKDYVVVRQLIEIPEDTDLYPNLTVQMLGSNWDDEGCMAGTLYDQKTGAPLSGVRIRIYPGIGYYDKDPVRTLVTDGSGGFSTGFLNAGAYTFVIHKDGYETKRFYESIIGYVETTVPAVKLKKEGGK